jgi:acetyl esterase/lipase
MKTKKLFFLFTIYVCLILSISAQNLTVKEIMQEPSIAGMRVEGEKLSPDGKFVVYLWNAEGKEPRDLYLVSTSGGDARKILSPKDLLTTAPKAEKENKLNYGLIVEDEFVKSRENQIGNLDWSPDSSKILFSQNGDIYVLNIKSQLGYKSQELIEKGWKDYEATIERQADLTPNIIRTLQMSKIQENELFEKTTKTRLSLQNIINENPQGENGNKSNLQKQKILQLNAELTDLLNKVEKLPEIYPQLNSTEIFINLLDERAGVQNRIAVKRADYNHSLQNTDNKPRRLTNTKGFEGGASWLDNERIMFSNGGNLFAIDTEKFSLVQISNDANPQKFISIFGANVSKNGEFVAYIVSDGSQQRALFVPNYLDEFVQTPSVRRGWSEQKVLVAKTDGSLEKPLEINLPKAEGKSYFSGLNWAADNSSLIVNRIDKTNKRRQLFYIFNVGRKDEKTILITEETDDKWIAPLSSIVEPNPKDSSQLFFGSERDGFNHLYLATLEKAKAEPNPTGEIRGENPTNPGFTGKVEIKQLTKGNWQIEWAKWITDGDLFIFSSTEKGPAERRFYIGSAALKETNNPEFYNIVDKANIEGMKSDAQIEGNVLLFSNSKWNQPTDIYSITELFCEHCALNTQLNKLTKTTPESFLNRKWNEPKFIEINSRDNKKIPAKIYLPADFTKSKKYPMVIFIHGAGYLQNVINGWNNYFREFMFNELLTQKGYVVLDIDYRGSAGYGRTWRTDVYDFLGGKDYEDHLDAIDFMVANYAVDPKKIGAYGGSYGGFMAEMLVMRAPDKIAAAAALRPVADWKNYYAANPVYTSQRLGIPSENAEAYKRSSPIFYADKLEKPLLILHGLVDSNVHAQDSQQLIEKLIRLGKTEYFEAMLYPAENHGFERPTSWTDEYTRILNFFEKHLK